MAKGKTSSGHKGDKNPNRRNGKANKKHPGVAPKAHNGKSKGGYSLKPELVKARAERKARRAAEHAKRVAA